MKQLLVFVFSISIALGASWKVTEREAVSVKASPAWKSNDSIGIIYKGEGGEILASFDDWIQASVLKSKDAASIGKAGWIWIGALSGSNVGGPGGSLGAALCDRPGNDLAGKIVPFQKTAYLHPGDLLLLGGAGRPTWYLLDLKTKSFTGRGWVYAPYGASK